MMRYAFLVIFLIAAGLAVVRFIEPRYEIEKVMAEEVPKLRPEGVPAKAVFRGGLDGGYYVTLAPRPLTLKNGRTLNAYEMGIYHSFSGETEYKGNGIYIPPREVSSEGNVYFLPPPSVDVILDSAYYSFGSLEFPILGSADLGRIVPLPLE